LRNEEKKSVLMPAAIAAAALPAFAQSPSGSAVPVGMVNFHHIALAKNDGTTVYKLNVRDVPVRKGKWNV
jgi:hypothetical protein